MDTNTLLKDIFASQGFSVMLMFGAIVWLNRWNQKLILNLDIAHKSTLDEKDKRITILESQVVHLQNQIDACSTDRSKLWEKLVDLAKYVPVPHAIADMPILPAIR